MEVTPMLILPHGFKIGSAENTQTGVTVILSEKGAVGGVSVKGCAPGTRETDLMRPEKTVQRVNAVVLTGGSAYGLASTVGVMDYLRERGVGFSIGKKVVPIVTGAVIYDLHGEGYNYPDAKMGYDACVNAEKKEVKLGQRGVGKGATVGKVRGLKNASKGGVGGATVKAEMLTVTAIVAVNAFGDVVDPKTNEIIAGAKGKSGFIDTNKCFLENKLGTLISGGNTTIGCVITNAHIDKVQANKLADIAHNGLARTIRPVHTDYDGDTMFALSNGRVPVLNFAVLQAAVVEAVEQAVLSAVKSGENESVTIEED